MSFLVYDVGPIDWGWGNLRTVEETAIQLATNDIREQLAPEFPILEAPGHQDFLARWRAAKAAASAVGWEGDFRHDPVVFWIPDETDFKCGFVFKQDNNGTTYVVSPIPLRHLEDYTVRR